MQSQQTKQEPRFPSIRKERSSLPGFELWSRNESSYPNITYISDVHQTISIYLYHAMYCCCRAPDNSIAVSWSRREICDDEKSSVQQPRMTCLWHPQVICNGSELICPGQCILNLLQAGHPTAILTDSSPSLQI